jgi:hypothetical protein
MHTLAHWLRYPVLYRESYPGGWFSIWVHWHLTWPGAATHRTYGTHLGISLFFFTLFFSNNEH